MPGRADAGVVDEHVEAAEVLDAPRRPSPAGPRAWSRRPRPSRPSPPALPHLGREFVEQRLRARRGQHLAPRFAASTTSARPMPCDAPVTSTRNPASFRRAMTNPLDS